MCRVHSFAWQNIALKPSISQPFKRLRKRFAKVSKDSLAFLKQSTDRLYNTAVAASFYQLPQFLVKLWPFISYFIPVLVLHAWIQICIWCLVWGLLFTDVFWTTSRCFSRSENVKNKHLEAIRNTEPVLFLILSYITLLIFLENCIVSAVQDPAVPGLSLKLMK